MSNLASKLAIGGSVVVVLLMLFSAVPVAAENHSNGNETQIINVSDGADSSGDGWEWDCEKCVLTMRDIPDLFSLNVIVDCIKDVTIDILGKVSQKDNDAWIAISSWNGPEVNSVTVKGGGSLYAEMSQINFRAKNATIENVSIDITSPGYSPFIFSGDVLIKDCPSVMFAGYCEGHPEYGTINGNGKLKVENSNLSVTNTMYGTMIACDGGIELPFIPSDSGLIIERDGDKIVSISGPGANYPLVVESFVLSEPNGSAPIVIGIIILALAATAVASYSLRER